MTMAPTRKPGKQGDVMQIKEAREAEDSDSLSSGPSSSDECVCDASSAKLGDVSENGDDKMIRVNGDAHEKDAPARRSNVAEYFATEKTYIENDIEAENARPTNEPKAKKYSEQHIEFDDDINDEESEAEPDKGDDPANVIDATQSKVTRQRRGSLAKSHADKAHKVRGREGDGPSKSTLHENQRSMKINAP